MAKAGIGIGIGIDISTSAIRAVELTGLSKARPMLLHFYEIPLPPGAVDRGEVIEPVAVADALKKLWKLGKFSGKDVVLGVGNSRVLVRDLTVPTMSIDQIRESLPFQVQEMLPFPPENALLDFYPIRAESGANGPVIHGLLVAAIKAAVLGNVTAVQLSGLNPIRVDLLPFALSRVLLRSVRPTGTTAIIDIGGSTTTVVVVTDGVPQFIRIMPTGGDDLTASIASGLGLSIQHADLAKRAIGLNAAISNEQDGAVLAISRTITRELIGSLQNTLSYFVGSRPNNSVDRIVLTGRGSLLSGFALALSELTRLPVVRGNPLDSVDISGRLDRDQAWEAAESLAVAIGLALGVAA